MPKSRTTLFIAGLLVMLAAGIAAAQSIQGQVKQLIQNNNLGQTTYGVLIVDLHSGTNLAQIDADQPMIPASNMKLITSAAALDMLERDFKFQTQLGTIQGQSANSQ